MALRPDFIRYLVGLAATFAGAWLTGETGSWIPLALGASMSLMTTLPFAKALWKKAPGKSR
jgi:hypothetical protein